MVEVVNATEVIMSKLNSLFVARDLEKNSPLLYSSAPFSWYNDTLNNGNECWVYNIAAKIEGELPLEVFEILFPHVTVELGMHVRLTWYNKKAFDKQGEDMSIISNPWTGQYPTMYKILDHMQVKEE